MRILEAIPRMRTGGAERVVSDLALQFRDRGHDVGVVSEGGRIADLLAGQGVSQHRVPMATRRLPGMARAAWRFARVLRREETDVVHSHSLITCAITAAAIRLSGRPVRHVFTLHHQERAFGYRMLARLTGRLADVVTTVCESNRRRLIAHGMNASRVFTVPNGVDLGVYRRAAGPRERAARGEPVRRIAIIARLIPRKGHRVLFDALGALWRAGEAADARLLVVGDGPERAALEAAAADDASLRGRIGFLGDHAGVPELLPELDLVALPSRSEGLPMCLVEALAVGVPVIGSAVDGIPEVVRHGQTGLLVPPEDPGALATALAAVIADPALRVRLIDGGARHVEERYRLDGVAGRYEALFAGETVCAASPAF